MSVMFVFTILLILAAILFVMGVDAVIKRKHVIGTLYFYAAGYYVLIVAAGKIAIATLIVQVIGAGLVGAFMFAVVMSIYAAVKAKRVKTVGTIPTKSYTPLTLS